MAGASSNKDIPNGAGMAAILAAGIGCAALGLFDLLADANARAGAFFNFYNPSGALSGVTAAAIGVWLLSWYVLSKLWSGRNVVVGRCVLAYVLLGIGVLLTFPPFMRLAARQVNRLSGRGSLRAQGPKRQRTDLPAGQFALPMTKTMSAARAMCALALAAGTTVTAHAGPPFMTDDPEPVGNRQSEAYLFSTYDRASGDRTVLVPAFEFNYGPAPDVHLHVMVPWVRLQPVVGRDTHGLGDIELGMKYRLVRETAGIPQVGIFPMLELPTGDADRGLGNGRAWGSLPLWVQKSWGPWTSYGGGGVTLNSAPGARDFGFAGWLVQREFGTRLVLGSELFYQGAASITSDSFTLLNVGGTYRGMPACGGCSLLFRAGTSIAGQVHHNAYLGLYWTWGPETTRG